MIDFLLFGIRNGVLYGLDLPGSSKVVKQTEGLWG